MNDYQRGYNAGITAAIRAMGALPVKPDDPEATCPCGLPADNPLHSAADAATWTAFYPSVPHNMTGACGHHTFGSR